MTFLVPAMFGTAATAGAAATTGLFGTAGAFSLGATMSTLGAGMGIMSALQAGDARSYQYAAAQQSAQYNAALAQQQAESTRAVYGQKEEQQRREAAFILGKQRAAGAQAGLGLGGSFADVSEQSAVMAELDALNIRYTGEMEAKGLLSKSALYGAEASSAGTQSGYAKKGGYLGAAAAALSGYADYSKGRSPVETNRPRLSGYGE